MKIVWEPDDLTSGKRLMKTDTRIGYLIGYRDPADEREEEWCLVNLSTGDVKMLMRREELCRHLNTNSFVPEGMPT